jgi:hypothetical protein
MSRKHSVGFFMGDGGYMNIERQLEDMRIALLKTQALVICLHERMEKAEKYVEELKKRNDGTMERTS